MALIEAECPYLTAADSASIYVGVSAASGGPLEKEHAKCLASS
jgi:hypothetical protein